MALQITESGNGLILVEDRSGGHRFAYKLATARGAQTLDPMAPEWAGGHEPAGARALTLKARELADAEAADKGWIEGVDPDVG